MSLRIPSFVIVPIILAGTCSFGIVAFLWWQLGQAAHTQIVPAVPTVRSSTTTATVSSSIAPPSVNEQISLLRQGDIYAAEGNWEAAEATYSQAVQQDTNLTSLRKLAQAQLQTNQLGRLQETINALKKANAKPDDILLLESIALLRSGELVEAKNLLQAAESSSQKHYGLLLVHIAEGDHVNAQQEAALVAEGFEPTLRNNANIIQSAYQEFQLFPEGSDEHLITLLSRALAQVQECELALPLLGQVTNRQPSYRDAWIVQGFCELQTNRYQNAISSYETAYSLDPQKTATQYFLGQAYLRSGQYKSAITFFEYALSNGFKPASEVRSLLAEAAELDGNTALAFAQYQELLQAEPTAGHYRKYITTALLLQSNTQAYEAALAMSREFSELAESFELLGLTAEEVGNTNEAITAYTRAISLDSSRSVSVQRLQQLQAQN